MNQEIPSNWTDDEVVDYFKCAALERAKCGFNAAAGNRIFDNKLTPSYETLARRGSAAVHKLLRLTSDENPHVRLEAATFAYKSSPDVCRRALLELMKKLHPVGVHALVILVHNDPEFAAEFERLAELGHEQVHAELARRYGAYLE